MAFSLVPLQTMLSTIDDLVKRTEESATAAGQAGEGGLAADLYEVERSLRRAHRRLGRAVRERS